MYTLLDSSTIETVPFPIPGATSDKLTAQIINRDTQFGPVFVILKLAAGARIPAHYHQKTAEQIYVLSGDFIENGTTYGPGTFIAQAIGQKHGPHATKNGCEILFLQPAEVDPSDFYIAE